MATGDILAVRVNADGWSADVDIENLPLGGTFDFGISGTFNNIIAAKLTIPVTSLGFDDTGAPTTISRTVIGTKQIRKPYGRDISGAFTNPTFVDTEYVLQDTTGAFGVLQYAKGQPDLTKLRLSIIQGTPDASSPWRSALAPAWVTGTVYTVSGAVTPGPIRSEAGVNYQCLSTHTSGVFATDLAAGRWIAMPSGTGVFTPTAGPISYAAAVDEFITTGSPNKITVRFALSDYVFASDTLGDVTVLAGLLTSGSASNAATITPTNNSTMAYPRVIGNWTTVNNRRFGRDPRLKVMAFHRSAQQGRSVRCVKFTVTDGTTTQTVTVTAASIDPTSGDALPVPEYIATFDPADFIAGAVLTCNFAAYPWFGDANSVLDTTDAGATAQPTGRYGPVTPVNADFGGLSQGICAVVDPILGNDLTGVADYVGSVPMVTVAPAALAAPFQTMAAASNAMRVRNNSLNGIDNCSDCFMYLTAGSHAAFGGTINSGATTMTTWLTITGVPGTPRADVAIASRSATGSRSLANRMKFDNITITASSTSGIINNSSGHVWIKGCATNVPAQPFIYRGAVAYLTSSAVTALAPGFSAFPGDLVLIWPLVRGNTGALGGHTNMLIGNSGRFSTGDRDTFLDLTMPNQVIAYNYWTGGLTGSNPFVLAMSRAETHGKAFIQNVLENTLWNASPPLSQFSADGSTNQPVTNILLWHNTWAGQRLNGPYDESAQLTNHERSFYQFVNNALDETYIKGDEFGSTVPFDGRRRGVMPSKYSVGDSGNTMLQLGLYGNFVREFWGLNSIPFNAPGANLSDFNKYVRRGSQDYVTPVNGAGNGDYHPRIASPMVGLGDAHVLPFDLAAVPRPAGSQTAGALYPSFTTVETDSA